MKARDYLSYMKPRTLILVVLAAIGTSACQQIKNQPLYSGGISPVQVRATMQDAGYDCALMVNTTEEQHVVYAHLDSAGRYTLCTYYDDGDTFRTEVRSAVADTNWHFVRQQDGRWTMTYHDMNRLLNIRMDSVLVSTEGVEFDVRLFGIRASHCTLVTDRADLSGTDIFGLPQLHPLLYYAIVDLILDADDDLRIPDHTGIKENKQ